MRKLSWIGLFLSVLILAGCSFQSGSNSETHQARVKRQEAIKKNQQIWNQKTKSVVNVHLPDNGLYTVPVGYKDEDMSLSRLKNGNQLVVKAQVINLQSELGRIYTPETKATIYVKQVISGDKNLVGHNLKTEFSGGLAKAGDYLVSIEGKYYGAEYGVKDPKTMVYANKPTAPMPKIGSTVVLGLNKYRPETKGRVKMYRQYGLTPDNFYVVNNPEVTFWVSQNGKLKLNNPAFYLKANQGKYPNLLKMTAELNK